MTDELSVCDSDYMCTNNVVTKGYGMRKTSNKLLVLQFCKFLNLLTFLLSDVSYLISDTQDQTGKCLQDLDCPISKIVSKAMSSGS